jgi:hypothetical protein
VGKKNPFTFSVPLFLSSKNPTFSRCQRSNELGTSQLGRSQVNDPNKGLLRDRSSYTDFFYRVLATFCTVPTNVYKVHRGGIHRVLSLFDQLLGELRSHFEILKKK